MFYLVFFSSDQDHEITRNNVKLKEVFSTENPKVFNFTQIPKVANTPYD